ncbi:hypothetical protein [Paenibacillus donghaensis]|uniref:Major tropism determinant N-terminal domain-containing protein n=1 Tax=Paenibacillus donghaensis TaxID=414771 RepID=A0A2Z2K6S5_9BACL|nr:hypothetical protein [Paenibacillus donghaensis]ASA21946.1 hypothetical protein B9T62_14875 [Paenibacillus donghaensis]
MVVVPTTIKLKRGLAANAAAAVLEAGEPMVTLDTGKMWVGDGSGGKILINPDQAAAETAVKLETARTIALGGDATGSTTFDGSANRTITVVLANSGATAGQFTKLTIDAKGRVTSATNITAADIPTLTLSKISDAGTAASKDTGTAAGNIPILGVGGKLDTSVLPALAISDTFVVATQAAMLALTAEVGDIAIRTDLNKTYILRVAGASTLANWQEILAPTGTVSSVAGRTGAVTLTATDVGLGSVGNYGVATQAEAETGTSAVKYMTPQRTAQAIDAQMAVIDGGTF